MELIKLTMSSANALELPPSRLGVFDRMALGTGNDNNSEQTDLNVYNNTANLMAKFDLHKITPNQMSDLGKALYDSGAISFRDYSRFVIMPVAIDQEQTMRMRNQPRDAIKELRMTIEWQEQQTDLLRRTGLDENKLLLNVMENLNSLSKVA